MGRALLASLSGGSPPPKQLLESSGIARKEYLPGSQLGTEYRAFM